MQVFIASDENAKNLVLHVRVKYESDDKDANDLDEDVVLKYYYCINSAVLACMHSYITCLICCVCLLVHTAKQTSISRHLF